MKKKLQIKSIIVASFVISLFSVNAQIIKEKEHVKGAKHSIIYYQKDQFAGWPANNGAFWFKNDEIVTGFIEGKFALKDGHNIDDNYKSWLARSKDGGETWSTYDPKDFVGDFGNQPTLLNLKKPIDFKSPKFLMRIVGTSYHGANDPRAHFFYSYKAGKTWEGPFGFGDICRFPELKKYNLEELTPRTDYIIEGKHECTIFMSARLKGIDFSDRLFCVKTNDGGKTFSFQGWIVQPYDSCTGESTKVKLFKNEEKNPYATQCRAVMSNSLKLPNGKYLSVVRRKFEVKGGSDRNWIDAYISENKGKTWKLQSKVANTGLKNGNPPAMAMTEDGRICVVYGYRIDGTIEVVYSNDEAKTWTQPQIIMDGFWSEDMELNDLGYPRLLKRLDGKLVAIYYYSTKEHPHHLRATIWQP
jgi:hypothetical protein